MEDSRVSYSTLDGATVISLHGEWDISNKERLRDALAALPGGDDVIADLRHATFFDSTALGELIACYKRCTSGGLRFETLVRDTNMRRLFELTSLDGLIGITPERSRYVVDRLTETATA